MKGFPPDMPRGATKYGKTRWRRRGAKSVDYPRFEADMWKNCGFTDYATAGIWLCE